MELTAQYEIETFTFYSDIASILQQEQGDDDEQGSLGVGPPLHPAFPTHRTNTTTTGSHTPTPHPLSCVPSSSFLVTPALAPSIPPAPTLSSASQVTVQIQYATCSRGGSIVSAHHDATGIFIWPATYLLCQYLLLEYPNLICGTGREGLLSSPASLSSSLSSATPTKNVLELGCGCGMVSSVLMKYHHAMVSHHQQYHHHHHHHHPDQQSTPSTPSKPQPPVLRWFATDMDTNALDLTYQNNHVLNQIPCIPYSSNSSSNNNHTNHDTNTTTSSSTIVHKLSWGNSNDIQAIQEVLQQHQHPPPPPPQWFDVIVAADIVYPTQIHNSTTLPDLFDTIHQLLHPDSEIGMVLLSYCHRDPTYQTLWKFIQAATRANFIITAPPSAPTPTSTTMSQTNSEPHPIYHPILRQKYLPPLLDAQILILRRATSSTTTTTTTSSTTTTLKDTNDTNVPTENLTSSFSTAVTMAQRHNDQLGYDHCQIFPGLRTKLHQIQTKQQRRHQPQTSQDGDDDDDSIWDAPPVDFND